MTGGCETSNNANLTLSIRFFEDAKSVDFYSPDEKLILSVDVSKYSKPVSTAGLTSTTKSESNGPQGANDARENSQDKLQGNKETKSSNTIYYTLLILGALFAGFIAYRRLRD